MGEETAKIIVLSICGFIGLVFLLSVISSAKKEYKNEKAIVQEKSATIVSKRSSVSGGHYSTKTSYYATFEFEDKERIEISVSGQQSGLLTEGDTGVLNYQGTRFNSFTRN